MRKILCIGFSVTVQNPGYVEQLKEELEDYTIDRFAIGGENMHSLLYMLNIIPLENYDICLLELSTSRRWLGNDYCRYYAIIDFILNYFRSKNILCGILDFSRNDVKQEIDLMHEAIYNASIAQSIPIQRLLEFKQESSLYLSDGIHTKNRGAIVYSNEAIDLIKTIENNFNKSYASNFYKIYDKYSPQILITGQLNFSCNNYELEEYERAGVSLTTILVKEGATIVFDFEEQYTINGLLLRIGPETARFKISPDNNINKYPYDERNYYKRFRASIFRIENINSISLEVIREEQKPTLLKGERFEGRQSLAIAGIFVSKTRLPF